MNAVDWPEAEREAVHEAANALHADTCPNDECGGEDMGDFDRQAEVLLAALAPFVAAREAQAAARALREAVESAAITIPDVLGYKVAAVAVEDLLNRADRIERGESS